MKPIPLIIVLLVAPFFALTQANTTSVNNNGKLKPSSISIFGIDFNDKYGKTILKEFKSSYVSNATNEITLSENIGFSEISGYDFAHLELYKTEEYLQKILNQKKVGQQILSYWFNRQDEFSFNTTNFAKNGYNNLNEKELIQKSKSIKGRNELKRKGLELVNQSFILIFDFSETQTMDEFYKESETDPEDQRLNGFISDVQCYLVSLDFNGEVMSHFFREYWPNENQDNKKEKAAAFENSEFPFQLKSTFNFRISSTQQREGQALANRVQRTEEELLSDLANLSVERALSEMENLYEPIRFQNRINSTKPITSEIGEIGWLKFDQRFFVYENAIDKNGKLKLKKTAVIKSNKVLDKNADDSETTFYRIAGKRIEKGMYVREKNDIGINIYSGYALSGLPGNSGKLEFYLSKLFGEVIIPGKTSKGASSIKIYLSGAGNKKDYNIGGTIINHKFRRGSAGISKDFYFAGAFQLSPFVGYGLEYVRDGSPDLISSNFAEYGADLGINLTHYLQLVATYNGFRFYKSILLDENREVIDENYKYDMYFPDRIKSGFSLGLRIKL